MREIEVVRLGRVEYRDAWDLQLKGVEERAAGSAPDRLFLCEHPHVITRGRKSKEALEGAPFPVVEIERGGDVTYHGPGQLVGYPVMLLPEGERDLHRYLRRLEEVLIRTLETYGLKGERREGFTGAWVGGKKVASIGVAVRRWVTFHGFALNVNTDLKAFEAIRPCGLEASVMTSMEQLLGRRVDMEEVSRRLSDAFGPVFAATVRKEGGSASRSDRPPRTPLPRS